MYILISYYILYIPLRQSYIHINKHIMKWYFFIIFVYLPFEYLFIIVYLFIE
jgi:hypothetical protein